MPDPRVMPDRRLVTDRAPGSEPDEFPTPILGRDLLVKRRTGWLTFGVLAAPFLTMTAYLLATRGVSGNFDDGIADRIAGAVGIALGLCCAWRLPGPWFARLVLTLAYVPMMALLLLVYTLFFVFSVSGRFL